MLVVIVPSFSNQADPVGLVAEHRRNTCPHLMLFGPWLVPIYKLSRVVMEE